MKQLEGKKKEKSVYFQNTKRQKKKRVGMNQVKVPNRVQSVFLYTISGEKKKILLELKHGDGRGGEKKTRKKKNLRVNCRSPVRNIIFMSLSVSKDECLGGAEKIRGRKENTEREKSIIQECKTVMHHSQIQ